MCKFVCMCMRPEGTADFATFELAQAVVADIEVGQGLVHRQGMGQRIGPCWPGCMLKQKA